MASAPRIGSWLALAALGAGAWWAWDSAWLWPLKILVVWFHEAGHAIATWATGGRVVEIGLAPDASGHTRSIGGARFLILNAGYLGSLVSGVALLAASRRPRGARLATAVLGAALVTAAIGFVRPVFGFGFSFSTLVGLGILALARWAPGPALRWAVRAVGVFSVLYALFDVRDDVFGAGGALGDAAMLADLTGIPGVVWGAGWVAAGVFVLWALRRWLV